MSYLPYFSVTFRPNKCFFFYIRVVFFTCQSNTCSPILDLSKTLNKPSNSDPVTPHKCSPLYALSLPAPGGLRLRQGEEDVRKLTPEGLLLRTYPPSLPTGRNKAPSPPSPFPPLLPVRALSLKKPLQQAHCAMHQSRNELFLSLVRKKSRRSRLTYSLITRCF